MTVRYDDAERTLQLSVRDVIEAGLPTGHLTLEVVQSRAARAEAGRQVHTEWQTWRAEQDSAFQAEVRLEHRLIIDGWTCIIHGRVDGLTDEDGTTVVEEVKSTALDASRLQPTDARDWAGYVAQLEVYLWMLTAAQTWGEPIGRLVLVSLADRYRHVIPVPLDAERIDVMVHLRLQELVHAREERNYWLAQRRQATVPIPHGTWRPGQFDLAQAVEAALDAGTRLMAEAPTGLGKTAAVLHGALRHALRRDKQLFWSTARTTHQVVVEKTAEKLDEAGLALRTVTLTARDKVCLNTVVACQPDTCPFANRYYDKLREHQVLQGLLALGRVHRDDLVQAGETHEVCPYQLAKDIAPHADIVIGDYNYVFDPGAHLREPFDEQPHTWVVVSDEAHHLVDRARGYLSPSIDGQVALRAAQALEDHDPDRYQPFIDLANEVVDAIDEASLQVISPARDGLALAELSVRIWRGLADRIDELGLDYALLKAEAPAFEAGMGDPWLDTARSVLHFADAFERAGDETVAVVGVRPARVGLICLDPSTYMGPRIQRLGGFVGMSATLSPGGFYRDLLGIEPFAHTHIPSPFPPENRQVLVAPWVSTAFKDREAHAPATADLVSRVVSAIDGNVAVYFPSFSMLRDIAGRWDLGSRKVLQQVPGMDETLRRAWLMQIQNRDRLVLAAVLGGIFAEGVDLPAGALKGVVVVGPALPPVGLERDLLREFYEERYGEGFRYASLVPGMTRVVQAAGRLIRGPEDRGVVVLVGRRFRWPRTAELLPKEWQVDLPDDPVTAIEDFAP